MTSWLRRIRAAIVMGLTWAAGWGFVGGLMEMFVDPHGAILDMWIQALAIPGFLCGTVFSVVLWMAEGRRRFDELSLPRVGVWGAVAGLLLGVFPLAVAGASFPLWPGGVVIVGAATLLSTVAACGSLAVARLAEKRELLDSGRRSK